MAVYSINRYREAKQLLPHLKNIIISIEELEQSLHPYSSFMPVAKIILTNRVQKAYIIDCYNTYVKILSKKGEL